MLNKLTKYLTLPLMLGALVLGGCQKAAPTEFNANGSMYTIAGDSITQKNSSFLQDGDIRLGIVSDIEAEYTLAKSAAQKLSKESIDAIVIAGDNYENERIRSKPVHPRSTDNVEEMIEGIKPFAELGVPVFVIPGNHETRSVYAKAIAKLRSEYPNVMDLHNASADLEGVNLVGMGGYHHPRFTTNNGFLLQKSDYEKALKSLSAFQSQKEPTLFVTHGPPKSEDSQIDYVKGPGHVGDNNITAIMNSGLKNVVNVFGHIHEGGNHADLYGAGPAINVAAITDFMSKKSGNAVVVSFKDGKMGYKNL